jgi:hypothetical protein
LQSLDDLGISLIAASAESLEGLGEGWRSFVNAQAQQVHGAMEPLGGDFHAGDKKQVGEVGGCGSGVR